MVVRTTSTQILVKCTSVWGRDDIYDISLSRYQTMYRRRFWISLLVPGFKSCVTVKSCTYVTRHGYYLVELMLLC